MKDINYQVIQSFIQKCPRSGKTCQNLIFTLQVQSGVDGNVPDLPAVIPGQYIRQRAVDALENYLRSRKGLRIPLDRAVQDLIAGGANAGEPGGRNSDPAKRMRHNLKIAVPNRTETFGWEPVVKTRKGLPGMPKGNVSVTVWLADEPVKSQKK